MTSDISDDSKVAVGKRARGAASLAKETGATDGYISFSESGSEFASDGDNTDRGVFLVPAADGAQAPMGKVQQQNGAEVDDDKWDWGNDSSDDDRNEVSSHINVATGRNDVGRDSGETPPEPRVAINRLGRRENAASRYEIVMYDELDQNRTYVVDGW